MKTIGKGLTLGVVAHFAVGCGLLLGLDAYSPSTCDDGVQGGEETGLDCGGPCVSCALSDGCADGVRNGSETDVDCGGQCAGKCNVDQGCIVGTDCASLVCGAGTCLPPTCDDKRKNGDETDRDCGGSCSIVCKVGQSCRVGEDCESRVCEASACVSNHVWSQGLAKTSTAYSTVAVDSAQDILMTGQFWGTLDLGSGLLKSAGESDAFVAKLNREGIPLWSKRFGGSKSDAIAKLVVNGKNLILLGSFADTINFGGGPLTSQGGKDIAITKLDGSGNHLWSKAFGGIDDQTGSAVTVDSEGNIVVAGSYADSINFGDGPLTSAGGDDIFVAKLSPDGEIFWSKRFGDSENQQAASVIVDSKGDIFLTGGFNGTLDFGSGAPLIDAGSGDVFVAKLNKYGVCVWSQRYGDEWDAQAGAFVRMDAEDNVLLAGFFEGTLNLGNGSPLKSTGDIFLAKLSSAGEPLWSKAVGNAELPEFPFFVAAQAAGNIVLGGPMRGTLDVGGEPLVASGKEDFFLVEYDAAGNHLWSRRFGDATDSLSLTGVAWSNTAGDALITGYFDGTLDLGGAPLTSGPDGSLFLSKLRLP